MGQRKETLQVGYRGAAKPLQKVWIALRASERSILETATLAHVATGKLPAKVHALTEDPQAWAPHRYDSATSR